MRGQRRIWIWAALAATVLGAGIWALLATGDETRGEMAAAPQVDVREPSQEVGGPRPDRERRSPAAGAENGGGGSGTDAVDADERAAQLAQRRATRAYRRYVDAINERDGAALCAAIEPGLLSELRPPVKRGTCAGRVGGSIGFVDKRGFPVWERTIFGGIESARMGDGGRVQLTASILTRFADRDEPSVESDVAYLVPGPDGYRLAKASGALWRAVGKPDVPPQVIAQPPGF